MTVEAVIYDEAGAEEVAVGSAAELAAVRDRSGTTWVRASAPDEAAAGALADAFDLHQLAVEDVRNDVRPKVEEFEGHAFLLVKEARLGRGDPAFEDEVIEVPVGLFVGDDWVVSLSTAPVDAVERVWDAVRREESRLVGHGPDFTAYRVLDAIVDEYFGLLDAVEDRIERFEEDVLVAPDRGTLAEINEARRDLLSIRKLLWPTREATAALARGDPDQVRTETEKYYRDVYDHIVQLVDLTETYRDLATGARDIYLNALSSSTNEVMKKLTVVATIVLPLTFVAGVYGMNFAGGPYNMPELGWRFGYPAVMLGMGLVALVMLTYFRSEGWL